MSAAVVFALPVAPVHALDANQVLKEEPPSFREAWKRFFSFRKQGQEKEAVTALEYAADQGDHAAQWKLGRMYQIGDGVKKDPQSAIRFFRQIADNYAEVQPGSADWQFTANAMVALGRYYRDGAPEAGLAANPAEAIVMFTTAATYFRHPDAQYELARMYLEDDNSTDDVIQAARMLKAASDNGHPGAQALLGQMIFEGEHLQRDPVRGLYMIMSAQRRASAEDLGWISAIQEEAFATATEEERRMAITQLQLLATQ
jgi:TPR repeat protein